MRTTLEEAVRPDLEKAGDTLTHLEESILLAAVEGHASRKRFYVSTCDRVTNILAEDGVLGFVGRNRVDEQLAVDRLCGLGLLRPEGRWRFAPTDSGLRKAESLKASDGAEGPSTAPIR